MAEIAHYRICTIRDHSDFEYELTAHCGAWNCSHHEDMDLRALAKRRGPDYPITGNDALLAALVCRRCGHKGGEIRLSARYMSSSQKRKALEDGVRERYVALPDPDRPETWLVHDRLTNATYANQDGPQIELTKHEARELADILNNPDSFYASDAPD